MEYMLNFSSKDLTEAKLNALPSKSHFDVLTKNVIAHEPKKLVVEIDVIFKFKYLKLSQACLEYIHKTLKGEEKFLKVKWTFEQLQKYIQSPQPLKKDTHVKFNCEVQGKINLNVDVINKLKDDTIVFELSVVSVTKEILISKAYVFVNNIQDLVNTKERECAMFINNEISLPERCAAYLVFWYRFICKKKDVRRLNRSRKQNRTLKIEDTDYKLTRIGEGEKELKQLTEKVMMQTNSTNINKNSNVQEIFQGNRGSNLSLKLSEEGVDVKYIPLRYCYKPELSITVENLYFLEGRVPLTDDSVEQVYVEYSFLGEDGPEMESPVSLPKGVMNRPTEYNWTKTFNIDTKQNHSKCKLLLESIENGRPIKFMVIGEPSNIWLKRNAIMICREIGFAEMHLDAILELDDDVDSNQYEVLDYYNPLIVVGYINIKMEGILALKEMIFRLTV